MICIEYIEAILSAEFQLPTNSVKMEPESDPYHASSQNKTQDPEQQSHYYVDGTQENHGCHVLMQYGKKFYFNCIKYFI